MASSPWRAVRMNWLQTSTDNPPPVILRIRVLSSLPSQTERFEVDSANTARDFLKAHNVRQADIDFVWSAIALHTTAGIHAHMHPVVALLTAGVEIDVLGIAYEEFLDAERQAVAAAYPRTEHLKEDIIQPFYDGMKHRPETTYGTVNADLLTDKDPRFQRSNFCSVIRGSQWPS
jgi:hypothetical protein